MARLGVLRGIYASDVADMVSSLPMNREPVIIDSGLSRGYLRPAPGIALLAATGLGIDRGGIVWNGVHYRVLGNSFCSVNTATGAATVIGDIGNNGKPVSMDFGFDRLAIASNGKLYYWDGTALSQVTDVDLGLVLDVIWISGYFMTTDGTYIVVTELNDPFAVNPLKYGSAEVDPDPIVGLKRLRGEAIIIGAKTIQVLQNVGGNGFPFRTVIGATVPRGACGTRACAYYLESFAFVGGGYNEAPGVYLSGQGTSDKVSTREVDDALAKLNAYELTTVEVEVRVQRDEQRLVVHLPTVSFVLHQQASKLAGMQMWAQIASGIFFDQAYRGRHATLADGKWIVGDATGKLGVLDYSVATHFGDVAGWRFDTVLLENPDGRAVINCVDLIGMGGQAPFGVQPGVFHSWTTDGRTWSTERYATTGVSGVMNQTVQWRGGKRLNNWMGLRFRGADGGLMPFSAVNIQIQALG
jgi:hypothetical protein